jgi:hypothetical protein
MGLYLMYTTRFFGRLSGTAGVGMSVTPRLAVQN